MKKSLTKKRVLLITGLLIISLVSVAYWLSTKASSGVISTNTLSNRGQEFVKNQQTTGTSEWNQYELADPNLPAKPTSGTFRTPCFQVTVPYQTVNQKIRTDGTACVFEAKVTKPPVQLVIKVATDSASLSENASLQMRLKDPKTYPRVQESYPNFDESYHFKAQDAETIFLSKNATIITIALNSSGSQIEIDQPTLTRLVDSILLLN